MRADRELQLHFAKLYDGSLSSHYLLFIFFSSTSKSSTNVKIQQAHEVPRLFFWRNAALWFNPGPFHCLPFLWELLIFIEGQCKVNGSSSKEDQMVLCNLQKHEGMRDKGLKWDLHHTSSK